MPNRAFVWMLVGLAVGLVVVPLLGAVGMMSVGWMGGHMMMGMSGAGLVWALLALIVVIALILLLISETSRT